LNALITKACLNPDNLPGYYHEENSHLAVACTIAAGHGDLGLGIRAAADHYGLHFRPVSKERYFLVLHNSDLQYPAIELLLPWLKSTEVQSQVENAAGYSAMNLGRTQLLETFLHDIQSA
jgi:putative molybdopterin biosynthesis protein